MPIDIKRVKKAVNVIDGWKRWQASVCLFELARSAFGTSMYWTDLQLHAAFPYAEEVEEMAKKAMAGEGVRVEAIENGLFPLDNVKAATTEILGLLGFGFDTEAAPERFNAVANCIVVHATELYHLKSAWITPEEYDVDSKGVLAQVKKLKEMYPRG